MKKIEIKLVASHQILDLRQRVLRPGKTQKDAVYPHDDTANAFHLAAYLDGEIGCVATFIKEDNAAFNEKNQFRLRGMATEPKFRKMGLGAAVLENAFVILREQKDCHFLWCYAREVAFDFYVKLGFSFEGEVFDIPEIGPHKIMYRIV